MDLYTSVKCQQVTDCRFKSRKLSQLGDLPAGYARKHQLIEIQISPNLFFQFFQVFFSTFPNSRVMMYAADSMCSVWFVVND